MVSFAQRLEERSELFYEKLCEQFPSQADLFHVFAHEDKLNKVLVTRTYQETVTDALETGYSFEGLNLNGIIPNDVWADHPDLPGSIEGAILLEQAAASFYADIAGRSEMLLSTIYTAFKKIEGVRRKRLPKLESLRWPE